MAVPSGNSSDRFTPLPISNLYSWIKHELNGDSIFGIPRELFFRPSIDDNFRSSRFGKLLETPVGLAAGPHTQLAQNIISGWLTGARYIELKTIQDLDQIEVTKPCIDMREEGYNCEWSQELNIDQSFSEYLKAWILIHFLKQELNIGSNEEQGFIFNMSAGYDLAGIKGEKVSGFLKKMRNSAEHKNLLVEELSEQFPDIRTLKIPDEISDNITVSTMHGTPPEEIEKIGRYFIEEAGLNTTIKLNPTLLGRDKVREIINKNLGYDVEIPDSAFEHDIEYKDALELVRNLNDISTKRGLFFGLKLTNTLECINPGDVFPEKENMAYMSGRALHPVSVNIASKFRNDIKDIDISFSAGADAFNIADLLSCNLMPVTVSSDILKPGGYGRIKQYIKKIEEAVSASEGSTIEEFIKNKSGNNNNTPVKAALININTYAEEIVSSKEYKKDGFKKKDTKTIRKLDLFDCIKAPCTDSCGTSQDVPDYLYLTSKRKFNEAFKTVLKTNSFPNTTGMVCDHQCQVKCTRTNYDNPLKIREVKRFLAENYGNNFKQIGDSAQKGMKSPEGTGTIAIIGAGPSGLSCARYLSEAGFQVKIYEKGNIPGGMIEKVIPDFRQGSYALAKDISRITDPNITIQYNNYIDPEELKKLSEENDYLYISTGAQESIRLEIEGIDSPGVLDPLKFLSEVKSGNKVEIGKKIAVIGGGNTAIDSARTALRVAGRDAEVTILYRRTKKEMPADSAEVISALEEGVNLIELIAPEKVIHDREERASGLRCFRTRLAEPDSKGRRYPEKIDNSGLDLMFDTIIPAVGQ
ncbi:MAG: FAD-dependent oxidoreductase, partial [Candidatus Aminicenantes bacterium]|nr:FAD-dependent oxidoreductase [Candidatus Aminicenantes bacterium]